MKCHVWNEHNRVCIAILIIYKWIIHKSLNTLLFTHCIACLNSCSNVVIIVTINVILWWIDGKRANISFLFSFIIECYVCTWIISLGRFIWYCFFALFAICNGQNVLLCLFEEKQNMLAWEVFVPSFNSIYHLNRWMLNAQGTWKKSLYIFGFNSKRRERPRRKKSTYHSRVKLAYK